MTIDLKLLHLIVREDAVGFMHQLTDFVALAVRTAETGQRVARHNSINVLS
jgi:hypothetical protein